MVFQTTYDTLDAKIDYFGGLAAIYPFIPFSRDQIREWIANGKQLADDTNTAAWLMATGIPDAAEHQYYIYEIKPENCSGLASICPPGGTTKTSADELAKILLGAASHIAKMTDDEFETFKKEADKSKMDNYTITATAEGTFITYAEIKFIVPAKGFDDAKRVARNWLETMKAGWIKYDNSEIIEIANSKGKSRTY